MPAMRSLAIVVAASSLLASCSDEQHEKGPVEKSTALEHSGAAPKRSDEWLELKDETPPADWLVSRAQATGRKLSGDEISSLKQSLSTAVERLGESARMIANRSVQLEGMLKALGYDEDAIELIEALTSTIGETGQTEGFGAVSQQYYNMRKAGLTEEQATADLRRRYGPRT